MNHLQQVIETAWERRDAWTARNVDAETREAIEHTITLLDDGGVRVCERDGEGRWVTQQWLKKAVLLYFKLRDNQLINGGISNYFDKVPLKFASWGEQMFRKASIRVVPPATVRKGAYIAPRVVLMPSYVNIGAWVDEGTMVDTWATIGSCAQIGRYCHISGGAGIGGVLEPIQADPVIIEDHCFIGARSEVAEGVIVREGSVLSMGVYLGRSTRIYDRESGTTHYGEVPPYSVVVPGSMPGRSGGPNLYCAVIVKKVDEQTRSKTAITELLRDV
ncbi:MAG: 2,3,4,5-tetrahydropyridine-2,6-dicarboxylate N-succinyltransferase [Zetaproteobacteria bacterium]|nr:MAG: 2,3,4,5-tetrahydropyridine-2,6-dicarboxylate N-succinyltransferase [Zetaproteobacteria bacterium]